MKPEKPHRRRKSTSRGSVSMINGNPDKWRVKVYVDGRQRSLPGGPWPSRGAAERALDVWNARRLLAEEIGDSVEALLSPRDAAEPRGGALESAAALHDKSETPFREVYEKSLTRFGGLQGMSRDRQTFYRTCVTGEAKTKTGDEIVGRMILGNLPVGRITVEIIENWAASLLYNDNLAIRLKPATVAKWGRHLGQTLRWAKSAGYITENPMESAEVVRRGEVSASRQPRYVFTLDELWDLREAAQGNPDEALLFEVLCWSGLRQGELRALTPECLVGRDVPLLQVSNSVNSYQGKAVLGPTKTRGSERRVPIPGRLMSGLKQRAKNVEPGKPLFPAPTDPDAWMRHEWLNRRFRAVCDAAGLVGNPHDPRKGRRQAPTPHGLRATTASILFAAGASVPEVQAFLGHRQPLMTLQVYTEVEGFGDEDPILRAFRGRGLTVAQILDRVYEATFARGVLGIRDERANDASAFESDPWTVAEPFRDEVTQIVVQAFSADYASQRKPAAPVHERARKVPALGWAGDVARHTDRRVETQVEDLGVIGTD